MKIKTFLVIVALLLLMTACAKEEGYIQTKDVSFLLPIKCNQLQVSDYYAGEVVNNIHLANVDTAVVNFKMKYGTHNILATIDGETIAKDFVVSDSTQSMYEFSAQTISIVVDDTWDGYIIYKGQ